MNRLRRLLRRPLSYLLLPLSALPVAAVVPIVSAAHRSYQREHHSGPLAAPLVNFDAAARERFKPVPEYRDAVPVLVYHGVSDKGGAGMVSRRVFATHMALLDRMQYQTISIDEYARWRSGRGTLPPRPILVTADGGWLDTYRGADAVLRRHGQRATIFVASGAIATADPALLTWRELKDMARSGRWDVQTEGHEGVGSVTTGPDGRSGAFYAVRRYTRSEGYEDLASFERRVTADVFAAKDELEQQGLHVRAIALPGGDYGQLGTNDVRIPQLMSGLLRRQFEVVFVRTGAGTPGYTTRRGPAERYEVTPTTTLAALHAWLRASSPAALEIRARQAAKRERERERSARRREGARERESRAFADTSRPRQVS